MNAILKFPFYIKFALISIGAFAFVYSLYIGQAIILPLIYVNPFVNFLAQKKINRVVAISIAVVSAVLITVMLLYFISSQLSLFSETYPKFKEKFEATTESAIQWTSESFNIKTSKINTWIKQTQSEAINNLGDTIGQTLSVITGIVIIVVLLPVYLFMILFYKDLLLEFIRKLFNATHHGAVFEVLTNSKKIIQSYLIGLLVEAAIVATLTSLGLLFLGIEYAIMLGILGALLNVIPYIGGVIATALPMLVAYVTKESSTYVFLVIGLYLIVQFIDNNIIIPRLVASKVKINALIAVIVVLIGGALWGIPGMFLSIPLTAIIKVIFDHIEPLKPWGYLLGNIVPTTSKLKFDFIKKKR
jgi:predicted PurR-regulated permease PerM